ncbi:MAG: hypothetical protein QOJ57_1475 [Thermoleophilaceae bacterium]|nr:hypothetical protein [Thermoleophilaceae bacterium]
MGEKPPRPESEATDVWPLDAHLGYRRSIESAGTVAAPLLAGFSFTLLVLLLPTLGDERTTVRAGAAASVVKESQAFTAVPELAAILLLLAGLALVFSVQAAITTRYYAHSPAELEEWYPEYFPGEEPPEADRPAGWMTDDGWSAKRVGGKWYAGWPRQFLYEELKTGNKWAAWTRGLYHLGIVALLSGLTALVIPPAGGGSPGRTLLVVLAAVGVVVELSWIAWNERD